MNESGPVKGRAVRGRWHRWVLAVAGVLVVQVFLIALLSEQRESRPRVLPEEIRLQVWDVAAAGPGVARFYEVLDPTVFALPARVTVARDPRAQAIEGSGAAAGWTEPERWLAAEAGWFGRPEAAAEVPAPRAASEKPRPALEQPAVRPVPLAATTRVELDGVLAERGLAVALVAPSVVHSNLLEATELQVTVEADGSVFAAVVLKGSGWELADGGALALARAARFRPLPGSVPGRPGRQMLGRMTFRWRTVAGTPGSSEEGGG